MPLLLAVCLPGCRAGEPAAAATLPLLRLEPVVRLELVSAAPGPATVLAVRVSVEAEEAPLRVVGIRSPARPGEESLLDLSVSWTDFPGDRPVSTGHSRAVLLPWGVGGSSRPGQPLVVDRELELPSAEGLQARRVDVSGRIIGVDLVRAEGHTGGTILRLPPATLQTFAPLPRGSLEQHLQTGSPTGIFLTAVGAPAAEHERTLELLIEALPALGGAARQAAFAALLYLTGETNGQDIHRWRSWWKDRLHGTAGR